MTILSILNLFGLDKQNTDILSPPPPFLKKKKQETGEIDKDGRSDELKWIFLL